MVTQHDHTIWSHRAFEHDLHIRASTLAKTRHYSIEQIFYTGVKRRSLSIRPRRRYSQRNGIGGVDGYIILSWRPQLRWYWGFITRFWRVHQQSGFNPLSHHTLETEARWRMARLFIDRLEYKMDGRRGATDEFDVNDGSKIDLSNCASSRT